MIPTPETVSAAWLTERLREAGHEGVEVRSFESEQIGTGQIGQCHRYHLDLVGAGPDTPRQLVGKFPSDDPVSRQTGVQLRNYAKEVAFYRSLQQRLKIRTPRCYFAEIEGEGPEHMLLLEDLAPAVQGDQLGGCTPEVAQAAVRELVGLHAPTWCDPALRGLDWLGEPTDETILIGRMLYRSQLPAFLDRFAPRLEADEIDIIERVADSEGPPFEALRDAFSVVHVDYRLDNLLIGSANGAPTIAAVDWQSLTLGNPLSDVAYFIGAGLLPEDRRPIERGLVEGYHHGLVDAGVEGFDLEACWNAYRRGAFAGFAVTVVAAPLVQQTERGDEMFTHMARRHARHALDLGAAEFLAG